MTHEPNIKPVEGYPGYFVTSAGDVLSTKFGKVRRLQTARNTAGYRQVTLSRGSLPFCHRVHRLVSQAFHSNPENKPEVNHINCFKDDNRACNLEWVTHPENMRHAADAGRMYGPKGARTRTPSPPRPLYDPERRAYLLSLGGICTYVTLHVK